jgi:cell division septation protein DedD
MRKEGSGGDMVLESRHLIGLFLGVVVLCGVFFTLGYVMGRTQYDGSVRAAALARDKGTPPVTAQKTEPATGVPAPGEWSYPAAAESKKPADQLQPAPKPAENVATRARDSAAAAKPADKPERAQSLKAPLIPRGAIVLQVAALSKESDALALAEVLQQKEFPAFVLNSNGGSLYRVQVGPYADKESADAAKRSLLREGFKAIVKR